MFTAVYQLKMGKALMLYKLIKITGYKMTFYQPKQNILKVFMPYIFGHWSLQLCTNT